MNDELETIRTRHERCEPREGFYVSLRDGQQAHADRATLLPLAERCAAAEARVRELEGVLRASATEKERAAFIEGLKAARDTVHSMQTNDPQFSRYTQDVIGDILEGDIGRAAQLLKDTP